MFASGTAPPSGVKLSWAAMTAPVEVPVVVAAKRPDVAAPKRTSLPSMLPASPLTPSASTRGLPSVSKCIASPAEAIQSTNIAAKSAQPWRRSPARRPKAKVSANGIARIAHISTRFVKPVGFSNGCAEFAFAIPPPFVPSSLIASWLATGAR